MLTLSPISMASIAERQKPYFPAHCWTRASANERVVNAAWMRICFKLLFAVCTDVNCSALPFAGLRCFALLRHVLLDALVLFATLRCCSLPRAADLNLQA